jgi:PiT family inorganic phosphate transporter
VFPAFASLGLEVDRQVTGLVGFGELSVTERTHLRKDAFLLAGSIDKMKKFGTFKDPAEAKAMEAFKGGLTHSTQFIPFWVKAAVAFALSLGTMVGWKRIVVTVGEKIGKEALTYGQGASAEVVAMTTIGLADIYGLPVSTTHVLSSGVAGTMAANRSGLQMGTLRNLLLAWVLTVPVCVFLGATIFSLSLYAMFHLFGLR